MPSFPTGLVTLVFTDIEGSSALWEAHHDAFSPVLEAHNRLMRAAADNWNGVEVKTEGDAFFLAFSSPVDAVRFAVEAQLALNSFEWKALLPEVLELRVRIGMHSGEPILAQHPGGSADYFGPVVNRASRVGAAGYGGQILVSDATRTLASEIATDGTALGAISFDNLGKHRLKGVGDETLWQVSHIRLPGRFPALKTLATAKHNLPPSATPFIGREILVTQWSELLREPGVRLLTLCGFGGQGKTRLALQIAENLVEEWEGGAWWVELEAARDTEAMTARIAHELRLHLQPQPGVREQLLEFLRERQLLLVLDNTEQIPGAGNMVVELLASAPGLKCLVTTRRAFDVRAERVVTVPPLSASEAVALFVERGTSRAAGFALSSENQGAIEALVGALEGVPLAIELAASRLAVLAPGEMLERLDERFRLLQTKAPDLPPRQRALRGAIDWSYELLSDEEKSLLGALSVFAGGFSLNAAETVSDDFEALEGVAELARHSFLRGEESSGQRRFAMLESVRAYAREKLEETADAEAVRRRHGLFFLSLAEKGGAKLRTRGEAVALDEFWSERANIAAALDWAATVGEADLCARLALALHEPLYRLGFWDEARAALQKGLDAGGDAKRHAALELRLASLAHDRGEAEAAFQMATAALQGAQSTGDANGEAGALNLLGLLAIDRGENEVAREQFEAALTKRASSDQNGKAVALHNLALLAARRGEPAEAARLYQEALVHRRAGGDARGEAETLGNMGVLSHNAGDFEAARALYTQSLDLRRTLRDRMGIALMLHNLGEIAVEAGDFERGVGLFVNSERIFREIGSAFAAASATGLDDLREKLGSGFEAVRARLGVVGWEELV